MLKNAFSSLANSGGNYRSFRQFFLMIHSVTGKNEYPLCTRIRGKLHIMGMVPDCKGVLQVDPMLLFGFSKKVRLGLDAAATIGTIVRTDIRFDNPYPGLGQMRYDIRVNAFDILNGYGSPGHTGLIRYDEQVKVLLQPLQGSYRVAEKYDLRGVGQVATVFDYGTITIQEHSGVRFVLSFTYFYYCRLRLSHMMIFMLTLSLTGRVDGLDELHKCCKFEASTVFQKNGIAHPV